MRLDKYLVTMRYVESRNAANKLIKGSMVKVDNVCITKPNFEITTNEIEILKPLEYVSRGGIKLSYAIQQFNLQIEDAVVVDVGASTGGFADVCLKHQAKKIYCVDVGHDQLALRLCQLPNVINLENTNVKDINQTLIPEPIDLVVSDLSFISSQHMFAAINNLDLKPTVNVVSLIKPQFELNPALFKKYHGVIKDPKLHIIAIQKVESYAREHGFKVKAVVESPILGAKKRNREFLIWCQRG